MKTSRSIQEENIIEKNVIHLNKEENVIARKSQIDVPVCLKYCQRRYFLINRLLSFRKIFNLFIIKNKQINHSFFYPPSITITRG